MSIDVVDVGELHFGLLDGLFHGFHGAQTFGMRGGDVMCIGSEAAAGQFGIDFGTTSFGMFEFLENDGSRAFAQNKTVAVFVERTGSGGWVIVAGRERLHGGKTAYTTGNDGSFAAAGYDDVGLA